MNVGPAIRLPLSSAQHALPQFPQLVGRLEKLLGQPLDWSGQAFEVVPRAELFERARADLAKRTQSVATTHRLMPEQTRDFVHGIYLPTERTTLVAAELAETRPNAALLVASHELVHNAQHLLYPAFFVATDAALLKSEQRLAAHGPNDPGYLHAKREFETRHALLEGHALAFQLKANDLDQSRTPSLWRKAEQLVTKLAQNDPAMIDVLFTDPAAFRKVFGLAEHPPGADAFG